MLQPGSSRKALRESVRLAFRKNKGETDPKKVLFF
jgi:hypothetical protein